MCSKIKCTRIWRELRSDVFDSIDLSRPCSDPRRCERWPAEGRNGGRESGRQKNGGDDNRIIREDFLQIYELYEQAK